MATKYVELTPEQQAAWLDEKRLKFIEWMKSQGYTQEQMDVELRRMDGLIAQKLMGPSTPNLGLEF